MALIGIGGLMLAVSLTESLQGFGAGTVYAQDSHEGVHGATTAVSGADAETSATKGQAAAKTTGAESGKVASFAAERSLLDSLGKREKDLNARETAMKKETERIEFLRSQLESKISELKQKQAEIEAMMTRSETQKKKEIKNLIAVYGTMKPAQATLILTQMEEPMALQILSGLDPATVSKILGGMPAGKAAELSTKLVAEKKAQPIASATN